MEDAATAEISRAQLWQWIKNHAQLDDGRTITRDLYCAIADKKVNELTGQNQGRFADARRILDSLVYSDTFVEFLTIPAYEYLSGE